MIQTLFLDAGGVLVFPNWYRIARMLADHAVRADYTGVDCPRVRSVEDLAIRMERDDSALFA